MLKRPAMGILSSSLCYKNRRIKGLAVETKGMSGFYGLIPGFNP